jgi:putative intracellular protease/amidase
MVSPSASGPAVPGPIDRVGFLAEQRRRRRQGGVLTALCAAAITLTAEGLAYDTGLDDEILHRSAH